MTEWVKAKVVRVNKWSDNLFSIILKAPILPFIAGQFAKISIKDEQGKNIQRAYSYVNSPNDKNLEFYITLIPNGKITLKLYNLKPLDTIMISKKSFGFFTLKEIPSSELLWMFATGTAIGPYCSILKEKQKDIDRFKQIILVYAVRYSRELNYFPFLKNLMRTYNNKLKIITIVSREKHLCSLSGRIPDLIKNNVIEDQTGFKIKPKNSHVMLCGNPNMVKDTLNLLKETRNMKKHFRRCPGHITTENYW